LVDFLQQISLFSDTDAYDTTSDRAALMTLHAAKGLEFENVFIVGVEDGILPHERSNAAEDEDELEEERRLFFVGITRAKTGLHISYARYRTVRGQMLRTIPSQFLFELGREITEQTEEDECYDDNHQISQNITYFETGFSDMGEKSIVVVKFNTGQTKSLMVKYADLLKI